MHARCSRTIYHRWACGALAMLLALLACTCVPVAAAAPMQQPAPRTMQAYVRLSPPPVPPSALVSDLPPAAAKQLLSDAAPERIWRLFERDACAQAPNPLALDRLFAWEGRVHYGRARTLTSISYPIAQSPPLVHPARI